MRGNGHQNQDWIHNLEWHGKSGFQKTVLAPWFANHDEPSSVSGQFRSHGNLTFATVAKSGHFVSVTRTSYLLLAEEDCLSRLDDAG